MRSSFDLAVSYTQAAIFFVVAVRVASAWVREKAKPQSHLALATGLYGAQSLVSALNSTINGTATCADPIPKLWSVASTLLLLAALFAFLVFLRDFIVFPGPLLWAAGLVTFAMMVLAFIYKNAYAIDADDSLKPIPCPGFTAGDRSLWWFYVSAILIWLVGVFFVLTVAFLRYARKVHGLARFRMQAIGFGFLAILVAVVVLGGALSGAGGSVILRVIQILALGSAPLLFLGFSPPEAIKRRYPA